MLRPGEVSRQAAWLESLIDTHCSTKEKSTSGRCREERKDMRGVTCYWSWPGLRKGGGAAFLRLLPLAKEGGRPEELFALACASVQPQI